MFDLFNIKNLENILIKIKNHQEKVIGEVYYQNKTYHSTSSYSYIEEVYSPQFVQFTQADISDRIDDKIKIFGYWQDIKNVIFYDSIYDKQRETIKKSFNSEL